MVQATTSKKRSCGSLGLSRGFTLYELLVGGAIGALVVAGVIASFEFFVLLSNRQQTIASESRGVYAIQAFVRSAKEDLKFIPPSALGGLCVVDLKQDSLSFIRKDGAIYVRETFALLGSSESYFGRTVQVFGSGVWSTVSQDLFREGVSRVQFEAEVSGCPPTGISMTLDLIDKKNSKEPRVRTYKVGI